MSAGIKLVVLFLCALLLTSGAFAQPHRKVVKKPVTSQRSESTPDAANYLAKIASQKDFDDVALTYHQGTPYALPHVMFIIDRRAKNKIYYASPKKYRFHKDFLLANYLVPRGSDVFKPIYIDQDRRFIVGTLAWQKPVEKFTWELWEGDLASAEIIKTANEVINRTFFEKVYYKPNSIRQEDVTVSGIDRVLQDELNRSQTYLALNTGTAVGRIHIIDKLDDTVEIGDNEILVLKELPASLPPVRGIIIAKPSSPLSHINVLARGWNIPNVYIQNADKLFREHNTFVFKLEANLTDYSLTRAATEDLPKFVSPEQQVPPADLKVKKLAALGELRKRDSIAYGSKSANLGEMLNSRIGGITVPDGFAVPYFWYEKFMKDNGFDEVINTLSDDNDFVHNPSYRRKKLDELRTSIQNGKMDAELREQLVAKWRQQLGGKPVFVRSSSNAEDLPQFSGAGLYSSVANVISEEKLIAAVKKVWASLWNWQGYEARVRNYVSQTDVYMSALIQVGVDMDRGGVMITRDPYNDRNKNAVYISAVCGHNSKVVDNLGIPEQVLFNPRSDSVVVKTLSQQENALQFNLSGDLEETADKCAGPSKRVLSDAQVRSLAKVAVAIKTAFGGKSEQDIEWGIMNSKIYVVQARPYITKN